MPESNKDAAVTFLKLGSSGKVNEAYAKYTDIRFVHHNPYFEGSAPSLAAGMAENYRQFPEKVLEVKQVIAEGDLVVVHSHVRLKPGDLGVALVHILRFADGRIVELWDVGQPVPEESPNQYGMF
jgi:predicted SnoaL-like aldol condensation-catalyzing enzyme